MSNKLGYPAGTVIQASDRQYLVLPSGAWKRLTKEQEVGTTFDKLIAMTKPTVPTCINRRRTSDGQKCYCSKCRRERKDERNPTNQ